MSRFGIQLICIGTSKDNLQPLAGVNVQIQDTTLGAATDEDGYYKITKIPVGLYTIKISYMGYETQIIPNITIKTNKAAYVNSRLSVETLESEAIMVTTGYFDQTDDAPVSMQSISYEEVRRAAGSSEDVCRMLQNFAGVNLTSDDRNDLIIRGGSPTEVLYTVDQIEIPNPNHFGTQGATGGPITMLNNEFIDKVRFMSGAFNATYGHKLSGSMDIELREGNREGYNGKIDLGISGAGRFIEGPVNNGKGSFLFGVHRSYLDLFENMLDYGGIPVYSNAQGKAVYDFTNNQQFELLFIGGDDYIDMKHEIEIDDYSVGTIDTVTYSDIDFRSRQFTLGVTLRSIWNKNFYTYLIASHSYNKFY
ncbi:MAG: TonB-dependent receptor, partial [Calditrichaceae bacterium]